MKRLKQLSFKETLDVDSVSYLTAILSSEDKECDLFNKILYRIIWNNLIPSLEEIRINRKDVAVNVVKTLKTIIEDSGIQWQGSEVQSYFDRMRKNISKYEPFELTDISNSVLQSVAAFVLKGEDFDSLKSYLEVNAISDYRYAFTLWGAMIGYVSIPRSLFDSFNRSSVTTIYHQVESILGNTDFMLSLSEQRQISSNSQLQPEHRIDSPEILSKESTKRFRLKVISFFESTIIKNQKKDKRESLREGLYRALEEFGEDTNSIKFVSLLNDFVEYGWKSTLKPWQTLRDFLAPDYAAKTSKSNVSKHHQESVNTTSIQSELPFDTGSKYESTNDFGHIWKGDKGFTASLAEEDIDRNAVRISFSINNISRIRNIIAQLNPMLDNFALTQIEKDLNWVFDPKFSLDKSEDELLNSFKSTLISGKIDKISKKGKSMEWKNRAYKSLDIDLTINHLRKLSNN